MVQVHEVGEERERTMLRVRRERRREIQVWYYLGGSDRQIGRQFAAERGRL